MEVQDHIGQRGAGFNQRRLISKADVLKQIPISAATMWREIAAGRFPAPVRGGARRVAFFECEILAWLDRRVAERDAKTARHSRKSFNERDGAAAATV